MSLTRRSTLVASAGIIGLRSVPAALAQAPAASDDQRKTERSLGDQAAKVTVAEYFSLTCTVVPRAAVTPGVMQRMLAADNGISTSHFQIYDAGAGKVAVTLTNFCKLQDMGPEDEDDILSCVHFLLVDVLSARRLLGDLKS